MKLNSISADIFDRVKTAESSVEFRKNSGKIVELSRNSIISTGRMIVADYFGEKFSELCKEKYDSKCNSRGLRFSDVQRKHKEAKFLFCAAIADREVGREPVATYEEAIKNANSYAKNETFWKAFNAIDEDVLTPLIPAIFEDIGSGGLMEIVRVAPGDTYEIKVESNDVFLFEDSSWGSGRSTTKNYLYPATVTLNPKFYSCNATIKWRQMIVDGDSGKYYNAIVGGMYSKMYALFVRNLEAAAANTKYVPAGLKAASYTTGNFLRISTLVAAANGLSGREDLVAFGAPEAVSEILPVDGLGGAITGLQFGLGEEWLKNGFIPKAGKVDVVEVNPVIVPGTQNSTLKTIGLGDTIYIAAKAAKGYAPIWAALGEGSPITITATPSQTADFTIDINCGAYFDVKPVVASKIGTIKTA